MSRPSRRCTPLAEQLGKTAAVAEDFPAFIVNRILVPMINEAVYALYEGVGSVAGIDISMKLGANHPMGPLELADFIGLDTCLSIMQVLYEGLSDSKYRPCPLLVKYVEAGWLGRKTNRGFYDYTVDPAAPDAVRALLRRYARLGQFRFHRRLHHLKRVLHIGRVVGERDVELALALQDTALAEATIEPALHLGIGA